MSWGIKDPLDNGNTSSGGNDIGLKIEDSNLVLPPNVENIVLNNNTDGFETIQYHKIDYQRNLDLINKVNANKVEESVFNTLSAYTQTLETRNEHTLDVAPIKTLQSQHTTSITNINTQLRTNKDSINDLYDKIDDINNGGDNLKYIKFITMNWTTSYSFTDTSFSKYGYFIFNINYNYSNGATQGTNLILINGGLSGRTSYASFPVSNSTYGIVTARFSTNATINLTFSTTGSSPSTIDFIVIGRV